MKKMIVKVSVGMILGVGALVLAPDAAMAQPPCTPEMPQNSFYCGDTPAPEGTTCGAPYWSYDLGTSCHDTDGDCTKDTAYHGTTLAVVCDVPRGDEIIEEYCYITYYDEVGPCAA